MRFALSFVALSALLAGCGTHGLPAAAITKAFTFSHSRPTHVGSIGTSSTLTGLKVTPTEQEGAFTATQVLVTRTTDFVNDNNHSSKTSHPVESIWSESTGVVQKAAT